MRISVKFVRRYRPPVRYRLFSRYGNGITIWAFGSAVHITVLRGGS